jgi:hypothetical protein
MAIDPSALTASTVEVNADYQIQLEHVHDKKYDQHHIKIKRINHDGGVSKKPLHPDIDFILDTDKFLQFCNFFEKIGEVRYGIK